MVRSEETESLARALRGRFSEEEASGLAELLSVSYRRDIVFYNDIELASPWKEELLAVAHGQRLLISMTRSSRGGSAWEDRLLTFTAREKYQMPRVARHLIERAVQSGEWDPRHAVARCLGEVGETSVQEITEFLTSLTMVTPEGRVSPEIMDRLSIELQMELDLHHVIDEFVRCGILSDPLQVSLYLGRAQYELNPSLYWRCQGWR